MSHPRHPKTPPTLNIDHTIRQGLSLHQAGRRHEAAQCYRAILEVAPAHFDALNLLGVYCFEVGELEAASGYLASALQIAPQHAGALWVQAQALNGQGRFEDALACTDAALAHKPDARTHNLRAIILQALGRDGEALGSAIAAIALRPDYANAYLTHGNVLFVLKRLDDALASYARAAQLNPGYPQAHFNCGTTLFELERHTEAIACLSTAIALKPDYAEAYNARGAVYNALEQPEESLRDFDQAIALKPDFHIAYTNRCHPLKALGRTAEQLASATRAVEIAPTYAEAYDCRGVAHIANNHIDAALADFAKSIALEPDYANAHFNEGIARLLIGDFTKGWHKYEWRWKAPAFKSQLRDFTAPQLLNLHDIAGKKILLHAEQGLGDTLQFCRYAPLLAERGAKVILEVPAPVQTLLASLDAGITVLARGAALPKFDLHCPLLSLPLAFGTEAQTLPAPVPYLHADAARLEAWRTRLGERRAPLRVGLVWSGSRAHKNDHNRSLALTQFRAGLVEEGIEYLCLQKELRPQDRAELEAAPAIRAFDDALTDFSETAALVAQLDLVITVDTSVAHLAGALGIPTWVLLPYAPDWRWQLERSDSPWYPSVALLRQPGVGDWDTVMAQLHAALSAARNAADDIATHTRQMAQAHADTTPTEADTPPTDATDLARWMRPSALKSSWNPRAEKAAQYIPAGATVLDIGCGAMALENHLPHGCTYLPADLVARDARTLICDLNQGEFPDAAAAQATLISFLGVLEYVADLPALLRRLRDTGKRVLLTYHPTDIKVGFDRAPLGWHNHLTQQDWETLVRSHGFEILTSEWIDPVQRLYVLAPEAPVLRRPPRIGVLSFANAGNFGDRLGVQLLPHIVPPHALISHHYHTPWVDFDPEALDLLIVGLGNSIFQPLLTDALIDVVRRAPAAIGIFGTQYRHHLDRTRLGALLQSLECWYARYEEDVLLYGHLARKVVHLGDWLIHAFPMAEPVRDETLHIGAEVMQEPHLDRTIAHIQSHRHVFSTRLHPLLCALTGAETVGYTEQREGGGGSSGKFRAQLLDIFHRNFTENEMWAVDRAAVQRYKEKVAVGIGLMNAHIGKIIHASDIGQQGHVLP